jgi:SAM-dependent methyltransferase
MSATTYKKQINEFYNQHFSLNESASYNPNSVAWTTVGAQVIRFKILCDIGVDNDSTILDFGCGLGHLVDYLSLRIPGFDLNNYTGLDINERYIEACKQTRTDLRFIHGEIFDLSGSFDYVIGSGVFTVMMPKNEILEGIAKAYEISKKGVAFNFLTKDYINMHWVNSFNPDEFYSELKEIYKNTKLITDYYGNEDFTIYIYK